MSYIMRPLFIVFLIVTLTLSVGNWYIRTAAVCPVPISYRLGAVDERFHIETGEVKQVLLKAEAIWENAVGRDLFVYDEKAAFAINLIYDERQQLASTEEEWRLALDAEEARSLDLIEQVKNEGLEYEKEQAEYTSEREKYEERLKKYNEEVESLNKKGGAPAPVFAKLQTEREALNTLVEELVVLEKKLNDKAAAINELGEKGNDLIELYNAEVLKYNAVYGSRDLYTQGDFQRDRINIYKYSDTTELSKVIVHEFGHSLGLGHVEGKSSIMYYLMADQSDAITLTTEDKAAFVAICGDGDDFASKVRRIIRTALSYFK